MDMDAPNLPIPRLDAAIDPYHVRTTCKVAGIALIASFLLLNIVAGFRAVNFLTIWALLVGGGLTALGFIKNDAIKPGLLVAIGAGGGIVGLLVVLIGAGGGGVGRMLPAIPFMTPLGMLGCIAAMFGLFLWARNGFSQITYFVVIGGLGAIALGLLVPVGGDMPLIGMFKALGGVGPGFFGVLVGIFVFLLSLIFVALAVATLLFVVLKGESASDEWVGLLGSALFIFLPLAMVVIAVFFLFVAGFAGAAIFFMALMLTAFLWLATSNGIILMDAASEGTLKEMF